MKSVHPHIIPEIEEWPIYKISKDRASFISELNDFTFNRMLSLHEGEIEALVAKTIYMEKIRSKRTPWKVDPPDEQQYWRDLEKEFRKANEEENKEEAQLELIKRIINRYNEEITGSFNPKTFRFARRFLTSFFKRLLNTAAGRNYRRFWGNRLQLQDRIKAVGHIEETRALFKKGVVVVVPTHFSNIDSIMLGYAMDAVVGIPAFAYGAGLNLYEVELIAYFMNRLGAYKVDRRKKNPIYLECLKSMACYSMQKGVNNIFFPGGTRSRNGAIEERLKLGLLGSVVESQRLFIEKGKKEKIFIIPVVLDYHFVLEAKYLINSFLKTTGKEKFIKQKDQYNSYRKIMKFIWSIFSEKSEITLSFCPPLDVLGNRVDVEGRSLDGRGNQIDLADYFTWAGKIKPDLQRETVYTKLLGDKILESYYVNNVVLTSHLCAFAAFRVLMKQYRELVIYDLVNISPEEFIIPLEDFYQVIEQLVEGLKEWEKNGKIKLSGEIYGSVEEIVNHGVKNLGVYHPGKPLVIKDDILTSEDIRLLFFYHNRLENYKMHRLINWKAINPKALKSQMV